MPPVKQDNPWPAVQKHLRDAHARLYGALPNAGLGQDRIAIAEAQNALENGMKAYAVACGAGYDRHHKRDALAVRIQTRDREVSLPSADWLRDLPRPGNVWEPEGRPRKPV